MSLMATLDTHRAVPKLQDAGAPEPLAQATVDVLEEAAKGSTEGLVTEAVLYKALLTQSGIMFGLMVGIAAASLGIAHWMFG